MHNSINSKSLRIELVDFFGYAMVILLTLVELFSLDYTGRDGIVVSQFLLIGVYSFYRAASCNVNISIYRMVYIFSYIFFFLAPLQQYTSGIVFWKSNGFFLTYTDEDYLKANLFILLFLVFYDIAYNSKEKIKRKKEKEFEPFNLANSTTLILLAISSFSFLILVITNNLTSSSNIVSDSSINSQLQFILRFIPVTCLMLVILCYQNQGKKPKIILAVLVITCVIIFFPFWGNMPRFFLLGSYLVVYTLIFAKQNRNKSLIMFAFVFVFSFAFTDLKYITSIYDLKDMAINFNHMDFDAYQMLMAMIHYVTENGIVYGKNILSALAFLIPRGVWPAKLQASGSIVAQFYGSWFTNVSMPIVGEAYFALGWLGIIVIPIIIGRISQIIDGWGKGSNPAKRCTFALFAGMTIYIMRGALLPAFAFVFGILLAIIFVCYVRRMR